MTERGRKEMDEGNERGRGGSGWKGREMDERERDVGRRGKLNEGEEGGDGRGRKELKERGMWEGEEI